MPVIFTDNGASNKIKLAAGASWGDSYMPEISLFSPADGNYDGDVHFSNANVNIQINQAGRLWTTRYGWLDNNFIWQIQNCLRARNYPTVYNENQPWHRWEGSGSPGETNLSDCYGEGNLYQHQIEIIDVGYYVYPRAVRYYFNCNCNCGGGGGGICFTENTQVKLADGTDKKISEIQIGDRVFNKNQTSVNTVKFIEQGDDTLTEYLYTPNKNIEPFATINHPLYIDNELSAPNPEFIHDYHPWLGKINKAEDVKVIPALGQKVYNLWVDGDNTYIVNGYGTHSIMDYGYALARWASKNYLTPQEVSELIETYYKDGKFTLYGGYLTNKILGFVNFDCVDKFMARGLRNKRKVYNLIKLFSKIIGYIAHPNKRLTKNDHI